MKPAPTAAPESESSSDCSLHAISGGSDSHQRAGNRPDAKRSTGTNRDHSSPSHNPGKVNASGSNFHSASIKINPISRKERTQNFATVAIAKARSVSVAPGAKRSQQQANARPVRNSTRG